MVNTEFFGNFLCRCRRIGFDGCSRLLSPLMAGHYAPVLKVPVSFSKLLESQLYIH